jgi:periplasmic protein TonB
MWSDEESEDERVGWKRRLGRVAFGVVLIGGLGAAIYFIFDGMTKTQRHAIQFVTRVTLPPPPPPPPPPPKQVEPEKPVETPKLQEPKMADKPPEKTPPKPQAPPATPLTAEAGTGSNPYGLAVGDGSGNVGGGGGKATYLSYGRIVSVDVQAALRREDRLRFAKFTAELHIWLDPTGKVTRVQVASSSGDPAVDSAVTRSLTGLAMREPPPKDMPQPIRLRTKSAPG